MSETFDTAAIGVSAFAGDAQIVRGSAPISITDDMVMTVLKAWIEDILGSGIPVVRGQDPLVPEPIEDDWIELTTGPQKQRIGTNYITYYDPAANTPLDPANEPYPVGQRIITEQVMVNVQVDVYGPNSTDYAQIIETLFRDDDACYFFAAQNSGITPLYSSDARQLAFENEGGQTENRWSLDLSMQANFVITRPQQFAAALDLNILVP